MKRIISALLILVLLVSIAACGNGTAETVSTEPSASAAAETTEPAPPAVSDEIAKAMELGFADAGMLEKLEDPITLQEFTLLLDSLIEKVMPQRMEQWQVRSATFRDNTGKMARIDGALALLYAAECLDADTAGFAHSANLPLNIPEGYDLRNGVSSVKFAAFPDCYDPYQKEVFQGSGWDWRSEQSYVDNAVWFVQHRSYASGKTYFDYNQNYTMDFGQLFTWEAALTSVIRVYETAQFCIYVPADQVQCTISQEALDAGAALPEASEQALPDWNGFTIASRRWGIYAYAGVFYQEEEVAVIQDMGFNFVRVPLDARDFFQGEDYSKVNPAQLENLDRLISWCAQSGIHVCIDLHDMVGFYTSGDDSAIDLFHSEARQSQFVDLWRFFARYYRDVSPNLLSFNLLNEPHVSGNLTDEVYAKVMKMAIAAIRAEDPDRIIVADMVSFIAGTPSQALVETGVVQSWHPYLITRGGFSTWPCYFINGFIHKNNGQFTMEGSFPADTKVTVDLSGFHSSGKLTLKADGQIVDSFEVGKESLGEHGCVTIAEQGTPGECRFYSDRILEYTLPEATSKIELDSENSMWYQVNLITISGESGYYELRANAGFVKKDTVPRLTLQEDGTVHDRDAGTVVLVDSAFLVDQFRTLSQFREETGIQIMAQEFGFSYMVSSEAANGAFDDILSAFDTLDIPWCCWCAEFGPLLDQRDIDRREETGQKSPCRPGATYVPVSENWLADDALMKIFGKYMGD